MILSLEGESAWNRADELEKKGFITSEGAKNINIAVSIATFMRLEQDGQTTVDKRLHMLEDHRYDLVQHIHKLNGFLNKLDAKIDYYSHVTTELCDCVAVEVEITNEGD